MPPKIVMQKLRSAVHFPLPENLERFAIEHENAARAVAIGGSKRTHVNAFRSTVNRVRPRIISAHKNFFRFDYLHDLGLARIGLRVDDVNTRRSESGHNEITTFNMGMGRIWTERRAACVPAEMVQLIAE